MDRDIVHSPVRELARRVSSGSLSAVDVASAFAERVEARASVHAWAYFDREAVMSQARAIDARGGVLPLAGVPIGVKDLMDTFDMPTAYGSPIYAGHAPSRDAACVAQSRRLGAVVMGKTTTTEFAAFQPGPTSNPRSPAGVLHTPGGSSSGSAAAVAAGMVPLALGTQTAGSIVRPAAFCGVVGYKPTLGMISGVGIKALAPSLDTVGVLARRVEDAAWFVAALTRWTLDPQPLQGLRVGVCHTPYWDFADADTRRVLEEGIRHFERMGARVSDAVLPAASGGLNEAQVMIMNYEAAAAFEAESRSEAGGFSSSFAHLLGQGARVAGESYAQARRLAASLRGDLARVFGSFDVLLAPSTPGEAPRGLEFTGDPVFNRMWSLLGNPCVHVPIGAGATGMPVGVTVVGALHEDARMLSAAWMLERVALAP
ncbi:amidase [Castellaniella sp. GW247-6E4]|uniref:amidase n=1 Tax=Castellaniella sp. GW247-6E4 TaxID=3140380 RepID=UPI003315B753